MVRDHVHVRLEGGELSGDQVQIYKLTGQEAISHLYEFDVEIVVIEPHQVEPDTVLGAEVDLVFEWLAAGTELRRVHAVIVAVDDLLDTEPLFRTYRLRLAPRAFRLTLVETQEIFLNRTVPQIITQKLELVGLSGADVEMRLLGSYPTREFVVQYKETDLAFISRLSEHLGISFFFEQHGGKDVMVFTDHADGFRPIDRSAPVIFKARGEKVDVFELETRRALMPSSWVLQDYNYRTPQLDLTVTHDAPAGFAGGVIEYGTHHQTPGEGKTLAQIRAEEREAACRFSSGESDVCELATGAKFTLEGHPRLSGGNTFLVVELRHAITQVALLAGADFEPQDYHNNFRVIDATKTFRPARVTPKPRMHGVATALVEPNADSAIGQVARLDEQGRYTVKFYFDPATVGDRPKSSQPVRMIQQHSGPNYGTHMPLKAGIEVLIVFVDGDPDRPLIVGSVHNPVTPSPVVQKNELMHRIKTAAGILIEMKDHF